MQYYVWIISFGWMRFFLSCDYCEINISRDKLHESSIFAWFGRWNQFDGNTSWVNNHKSNPTFLFLHWTETNSPPKLPWLGYNKHTPPKLRNQVTEKTPLRRRMLGDIKQKWSLDKQKTFSARFLFFLSAKTFF